jgi:arabinose-5-phosphate isomerase
METKKYAIKCFQDEAQAILDLIPQLTDDFDKAVELVYNCKGKFIITGVGKSGHIGAKIAATLASTGTPSFFVNPLDAYHGDLGMFSPEDVVMAISNSGNTDELLRFIPLLLDRKIPIIGMSGNPNSLLAQYSTCHLNITVKKEACPLNLAPTSSTTATLAMGDALACALMEVRHFKASDFAQFHPGGSLGRRLLTQVKDVMKRDNLPVISPDMRIAEALTMISEGRLGMAVVMNNNDLLGLVTDGDIRRTFQKYERDSFDILVKDIMVTTPITVHDTDKIINIEPIFKEKKVHTLVVLDHNGHFIGFVSSRDCIM